MEIKAGRPRDYGMVDLGSEFTNRKLLEVLEELRTRAEDQISDLTADQLDAPYSEQNLTIRWLFLHLNWAEISWMKKLTGREPEESSLALFEQGRNGLLPSPIEMSGQELTAVSKDFFSSFIAPTLFKELDFTARASDNPAMTAGQICSHLFWHWSYHSGQIGLLRLMGGKDYAWSFKQALN